MAWNPDLIADAGLKLLNEVGLDGLSTRRLATAMNVKSPALYKHFSNKAELLDYMATAMLRQTFSDLDPCVHWSDWLRDIAAASRAALWNYRDGARLLLSSSPAAPLRSQLIPVLAQPLVAAGLDEPAARKVLATLASMVMGWMLNEQDQATRAMMATQFHSGQEGFDEAVEFIIAGVAVRHAVMLEPLRHKLAPEISSVRLPE